MKGLFDQGVPAPLRAHLPIHTIDTAAERGWSNLANGDMLNAAEAENYEFFVTTDQNLKYQQSLVGRRIAIVVLKTTAWPRILRQIGAVVAAIDAVRPGAFIEVAA